MHITNDLCCPLCKGEIFEINDVYHCDTCLVLYNVLKPLNIFDLSRENDSIKISHFNELYKTADDLETRIKFFNTRFTHNLANKDLFEYLNKHKKNVLEVGCGTMKPLLPIGADYMKHQSVTGIDISIALLARALELSPKTRLIRANAEALPFKNGSFDLIWARHMLYHSNKPENVISECLRCLEKNGIFCVSTNSEINKVGMHNFHSELLNLLNIERSPPERASRRFSAEKGYDSLSTHFKHILILNYSGQFAFQTRNEFLDYYYSTAYFKWLLQQTKTSFLEIKNIGVVLFDKMPVYSLDNNGAVMFATNSLDIYNELKRLQ